MSAISYETFSRAAPNGIVLPFYGRGPCLETTWTSNYFVLHRHRTGARKVRRILRRAKRHTSGNEETP